MTGCYRFVGRDCEAQGFGPHCRHCGCPISARSVFKDDGWTCRATWRAERYEAAVERFSTPSEVYRSRESAVVEKAAEARRLELLGKNDTIADALADTRKAIDTLDRS